MFAASGKSTWIIAQIIEVITLLITASGVFGEMQSALNTIWKVESHGTTITHLLRARVVLGQPWASHAAQTAFVGLPGD